MLGERKDGVISRSAETCLECLNGGEIVSKTRAIMITNQMLARDLANLTDKRESSEV